MTIRLAILGDSIAVGQGAARPSESLGPRLVAGLADQDIEATARVFGARGARSSVLSAQVADALSSWAPDVAVIVIGANDLTHRTPPDQAARHLGDAVRRLRQSGAEVVLAPAPDLSTVPFVPAPMRPVVRVASALLRDRQVSATTAAGGRVADADARTSEAFATDPSLFSADRFHPSSTGYAVIAEALLSEVRAAAAATRPVTAAAEQ
jgi:lysophospholipase L1-like esterase